MYRRARQHITHRGSRESARQTASVIALGALLAVGIYATGKFIVARQQASAEQLAAAGGNAGARYTGSILYMPDDGRTCRQRLFDNRTGHFSDNGEVDCANAAYQGGSGSPKQWSAARARVISSGFREH